MLFIGPPRTRTKVHWCSLSCGISELYDASTYRAQLTRKPKLFYWGTSLPLSEPQFPYMHNDDNMGCLKASLSQIWKPHSKKPGSASNNANNGDNSSDLLLLLI